MSTAIAAARAAMDGSPTRRAIIEALIRLLAANRSQQAASSHDLVEDAELMAEDREIDGENQGSYS